MRVWQVRFKIELEGGDPEPTGTASQIAGQVWNAITARDPSTFTVKSVEMVDETVKTFEVLAVGDEVV